MLHWEGLTGNRHAIWAIAACVPLQLAFTYLPAMQSLFGSTGPSGQEWFKVLAAGLGVFLVAEIEKLVMRSTRLSSRLAQC